eukprot:2026788-Ditylum_brightwellii.AAC.1
MYTNLLQIIIDASTLISSTIDNSQNSVVPLHQLAFIFPALILHPLELDHQDTINKRVLQRLHKFQNGDIISLWNNLMSICSKSPINLATTTTDNNKSPTAAAESMANM